MARQREEGIRRAAHCAGRDCGRKLRSYAEVRRRMATTPLAFLGGLCESCQEAARRRREEIARERVERERAAVAARREHVAELAEWAREALADPRTVVLDTETTGLHERARIVELAVVAADGTVLMDTLVNPGEPIPADATAVHGITDEDVAGAPRFADLTVELTEVLDYRRVLIYNEPYDRGRLLYELDLRYRRQWVSLVKHGPHEAATAWLEAMRLEDVMIPYSDWVGEWDDYHGNYRWQRLDGGHRAVGDCRAVLDLLRAMAATAAGELAAAAREVTA